MLTKKRALGFKIQAAALTPETITAAEIIFVENLKFNPSAPPLPRNPHLTTLSQQIPVAGRPSATVSFEVQMYGGAAAGTAPFWGALLQACGFAETVSASTSVTYKPASSSLKIATIKAFMDGIAYTLSDCVGTVSCEYRAGEVPRFSFTFSGLWNPALDASAVLDTASLVGNAFPAFLPKPFTNAVFRLDSYAPVIEMFRWDIANAIGYAPDANVSDYRRIDITGRNPKGEFDAEAVLEATYDFVSKFVNKTPVAISAFAGAVESGNGTGTLNTMTDSTKRWITNQFQTGYKLRDSAGAVFTPTANTATAITVSGTPASGMFEIYEAGKLIQTSIPKAVFEGFNDNDAAGIYRNGVPFGLYFNTGDDEISLICT